MDEKTNEILDSVFKNIKETDKIDIPIPENVIIDEKTFLKTYLFGIMHNKLLDSKDFIKKNVSEKSSILESLPKYVNNAIEEFINNKN